MQETPAKEYAKVMLVNKELKVYGYDIDVMGIVSNIVFVRWFEEIRTKFLDVYFPLAEMLDYNCAPIIAKTEINYKYPVTIKAKPIGEVWVEKMGRSKWEMSFRIYEGERVYCTGRQTGYYFSMETNRPVPMPEKFYDLYLRELEKSGNIRHD